MAAGAHLSKDFFDLIKSIGESKSKQEEDRIIVAEVAGLKRGLGDRGLTGKRLREYLIRVVYVEMLGHDASFGYMKAVELCASSNLMEKRVAYLCAALCFAPEHEFRMMLVNRMQRDLQSANVLEVSIALTAAAKVLTSDMIPAVLPLVSGNLLKHDQEIIRKKSVMLLQRFHALQADSVSHMGDRFRRALCDKDPSVMGASLHLFADLAKADPGPYKDLVSSFVSILKQITEHRLPRDFDYHRIPAPWVQMKLLRILALLCRADQAASEQTYEVLLDVMRRADTGINVGYAIVYECVRTVTAIYPNTALLDAAAAAIGRFLASDNHNLKYLGVTGLASIVKDHPRYAAEHQLAVIDCLEDPDDTLKRKTLDLLYRMTNPVNVAVIVDKLASHLKASTDPFLRSDLVARITAAAEQFAPSNSWYLTTMTSVFELGGDLVRPEVAQNLIRLVAEGTGESEEGDAALRAEAVATYSALLERHIPDPATAAAAAAEAASSSENGAASSSNTSSVNAAFTPLPDVLVQVLTWVLGEYAHLPTNCLTVADTAARLAVLAQRPGLDVSTRGYALDAVIKLTSSQMQVGAMTSLPPACAALLAAFTSSRHVELSQRCREWSALLARSASGLPRVVLPIDASTEDITVDEELPFLAGFVANALSAGAKPYSPPQSEYAGGGGDGDGSGDGGGSGLRFDEYKREEPPSLLTASAADVGGAAYDVSGGALGGGAGGLGGFGAPGGAPGLLGGQGASRGVWGKEGYRTAQGVLGANAPPAVQPAGGMIPAVPSAPDVTSASNQFAGPIPPLSGASGSSRRPWDALPLNSPQQPGGAPAAAAPEPPKPRELTEKEKQAALLFGGILPGAPAPAPAAAAAARRPTPAAAPAPVAAAPAPVAAAPRPAPAPAPAAAVDDLLGIFGAPAPAPAPAAAAFGGASAGGGFGVSGGGFSGGGGDMFGGLNSAMGGLSLSSSSQPTSAAAAPSAGPPLDVTSLPVPPALVPLISAPGARREPASGPPAGVKIAEAGPLAVAAHRVLAPEALHVVLTVAHTGLTSAPLPGVNVTLNPHPFLAVAGLRSSVGGPAGPSTVSLGSLAPRSSGTVVATLALSALPSGGPSAPLSGSLAVPGQPPIPFSVDIPVTDVLRPAPMDTPSFGGLWTNPAMTSESVANVAGSSIRSPADLMARVGTAMNAHPVQMIAATSEAIASCRLMGPPSPQGPFLLLHMRVSPAALEVRVKAGAQPLVAAVAAAAQVRLR